MAEQRQDRRVRRSKAQLRQALIQLLQEKPVEEITVRELTERADVNRGTFYSHYQNIYHMLEQVENELFDELGRLLDAYPPHLLRASTPWAVWTAPTTVWSSSSPGRWAWPAPGPFRAFLRQRRSWPAWPIGSSPLVSPARFSTSIDFLIFRSIFLWKSPVEKMKEIVAGPFFFR